MESVFDIIAKQQPRGRGFSEAARIEASTWTEWAVKKNFQLIDPKTPARSAARPATRLASMPRMTTGSIQRRAAPVQQRYSHRCRCGSPAPYLYKGRYLCEGCKPW